MANICYEVVTDASLSPSRPYESKPLYSGRRQRFLMDQTVKQEKSEKNYKRNKHDDEESLMAHELSPRYGVSSVCGRRREMEDAVAMHPSFSSYSEYSQHYFDVYDGHGCSHVAARCKERLHKLVQEEMNADGEEWKKTMERSFKRMDEEVVDLSLKSRLN